jgi:hypothetical protein
MSHRGRAVSLYARQLIHQLVSYCDTKRAGPFICVYPWLKNALLCLRSCYSTPIRPVSAEGSS